MPAASPLLRVWQLLNDAGAKYLICGAQACILLNLDWLIASKETYREQDVWDRARLLELKKRQPAK
jgi:hypothetical protein